MTQTELSNELRALLRLLREHEFLRYSAAGRAEYDDKLRTACGLFASAVAGAVGFPMPNPYPSATIEGFRAEGCAAAEKAARRIAVRLRSGSAPGTRAASEAWLKAAERITTLPRDGERPSPRESRPS